MVIDFHTHCFPDSVAKNAINLLEQKSGLKNIHDGTTDGLKKCMRTFGVKKSVVLPVATKPSQVITINRWAKESADDKLSFFGAIHPDDPNFLENVQRLKEDGFRGVKLHPDYQNFFADEPRMLPLYAAIYVILDSYSFCIPALITYTPSPSTVHRKWYARSSPTYRGLSLSFLTWAGMRFGATRKIF